jgi:predicted dehydrogenase
MPAHVTNPVGVALIGAGPWGKTLARAFSGISEVRLRWICDLDAERRTRVAAAHPEAEITGAVDEVLADAAVRAAIVAVDSPNHHSVGLRVLAANRHLLVEKPLALSVPDAIALLDGARARGRVLTVGHLLLHHPAVARVRELVAGGAIGDPLGFESVRAVNPAGRKPQSAWWTLAPHDVSLAIHFFDAVPVEVSAVAGRRDAGDQDFVAYATLRFTDGRLAHVHAARVAAAAERRFSVIGSRRSLVFDELALEHPLRFTGGETAGEIVPIDALEPLSVQCRHFISCVSREDPNGGNGGHAVAVVRVLEAGARSMRAGGAPIEVA